jgi:hypothetical protein
VSDPLYFWWQLNLMRQHESPVGSVPIGLSYCGNKEAGHLTNGMKGLYEMDKCYSGEEFKYLARRFDNLGKIDHG